MKNLKRIDEAVGSILERRAAADRLLKDVINGNTSEVEGIKLSKQMAQGFLDWLKYSTYGKKFGALPFNMLFTAAFNWGLDRYVKGARTEVKDEFKELKAKAKEMSKQQKMKAESVNEEETLIYDEVGTELASLEDKINDLAATATDPKWSRALDSIGNQLDKLMMTISKHDKKLGAIELNEKRSSPYGEIMLDIDAASKQVKLPMSWMKDYVKSIERMAKRNAKKFFKDYGSFSVDDWAEDMEYNFANESKVNEAKFNFSEDEVKNVADLIAKAIAKTDRVKAEVHDMEYDAGRGAGFEISMDGEKYDGGSYVIRPNGDVVNVAIGNSFPNAIYAKIGDKDIKKIMKNIKKFESVEVNESEEDFKPHMMYDPKTGKGYKADTYEDHVRMDKMGYVHEKPEKVDEAKFVKSYDTKVNDAETEKEVLKIYPKAKFFVGKMSHFFGELEPNLFFKAYYPKYYKQDTGKTVKGDFKITSVYSQKGSRYVELMKESVLENFKTFGEFVSENYDTEQRKEMAAKGLALSDGSFPIANLEDLKNAIMAYGRAKDQARAAKFIAKRAKALGAEDLIPDTEDFQKSLKG
tara:strand:+ start:256 stop:1998 length:1743 start_codon:yes stop_codon:yes gene_type:complete